MQFKTQIPHVNFCLRQIVPMVSFTVFNDLYFIQKRYNIWYVGSYNYLAADWYTIIIHKEWNESKQEIEHVASWRLLATISVYHTHPDSDRRPSVGLCAKRGGGSVCR